MDLRGYGLSFPPGFSAYTRMDTAGIAPDPRDYYEYERDLSVCDLNLSDGPGAEDMPPWTRSAKSSKKSSSKANRSPKLENRQPELRTPLVILKNQNPGIDNALRNLIYEVNASLKMYQALVKCFEADIETLRDWAEQETLDAVWRNKVKAKCHEKHDRQRFEGAVGRIANARAAIKGAVKIAKAVKDAWEDRFGIERQIRTAKKTLLYCDGIIDLAERAPNERLACKQLVSELEEVKCLLDRTKHPWIYGEDLEEDDGAFQPFKDTEKKSKGARLQRNEMGSNNGNSDRTENDGAEQQDESGDWGDNPPDQSWGGAGEN